ncbi:hypothetical protein ACO2Q1_15565 [Brevundimonas sp. VNH65]|uniref:hypothetical protein n=1 Tax=Brevundimonas sp. VNH65 TaxID=3400917 RepID=UPI003C0156EA
MAVRIWLGGLIGFLIVAVGLALLGWSAGVLFVVWITVQLGNVLAWAWDLFQTRRMVALSVLLGLSIASMVVGLMARGEVERMLAGSGAFPW